MAYLIVVKGLVGVGDYLEYELDTDDQLEAEKEAREIYFCKNSESDPHMSVSAFEIVDGEEAESPAYVITAGKQTPTS